MIVTSSTFRFSSYYGGVTDEFHPGLDVEVGLGVGNVVDYYYSAGTLVVDLA
jgi:hypothetical protein